MVKVVCDGQENQNRPLFWSQRKYKSDINSSTAVNKMIVLVSNTSCFRAYINAEQLLADSTPIFSTVYLGPNKHSGAPAVFLLCGRADSDSSFGLVSPTCRLSDVLFQYNCLFLFVSPPPSLPGALQSAQTSVLWSFLDISKVAGTERRMGLRPMGIFARLPSSQRRTSAVNRSGPWIPGSRVAWSAFPGQLRADFPSWISPLVQVSHQSPPFIDEMRRTWLISVYKSHIGALLLNLAPALPPIHRETAALYLQVIAADTHPALALKPTYRRGVCPKHRWSHINHTIYFIYNKNWQKDTSGPIFQSVLVAYF